MWVAVVVCTGAEMSSFSGGSSSCKRSLIKCSSMAVTLLMIVFVLQIWVCCDCQAGAIRVFPTYHNFTTTTTTTTTTTPTSTYQKQKQMMMMMKGKALLQKYFSGRAFHVSNRTGKGFEDSKRRVPSCPDPLHN